MHKQKIAQAKSNDDQQIGQQLLLVEVEKSKGIAGALELRGQFAAVQVKLPVTELVQDFSLQNEPEVADVAEDFQRPSHLLDALKETSHQKQGQNQQREDRANFFDLVHYDSS